MAYSGSGRRRRVRRAPAMGMGGRRRRRRQGGGIGDFLSKANNFLKKTGLVRKLAGVYSTTGLPGASIAGQIRDVAAKAGYGRRRRRRAYGGRRRRHY